MMRSLSKVSSNKSFKDVDEERTKQVEASLVPLQFAHCSGLFLAPEVLTRLTSR
jgi:hypothetical protein